MKLNQSSIFHLLKSAYPDGLSVKQILSLLYLGANKRTQLRKILREFGQKKTCYKSNNKYFLSPDATQLEYRESTKSKKKKRSKTPQNDTSNTGIWIFQNGKGYIQDVNTSEHFKLQKNQVELLIHGDVVRYQNIPGAKQKNHVQLVDIIKRRINKIYGHIHIKKNQSVLIPESKHFHHRFLLQGKRQDYAKGELSSWIEISKYPQKNITPLGKLIPPLESVLKEAKEELYILDRYALANSVPELTATESKQLPTQIRLNKSEGRKDLRDLAFVTIDGADARDFDDAIYAEEEEAGYRIWVSIADVSHYVQRHTNMDEQALERSNSTYFPNRVIPMLPERLSNNICSLIKNKNRLTLTCEIQLDSVGEPVNFKIYKSIIRVCARLTYDQVDLFIQTGSLSASKNLKVINNLPLYLKISQLLRQKRLQRGMINFNLPETRFEYDDHQQLLNISKSYQSDAQKLIEQFMLEANEGVGKFCHDHQIPNVWRNHVDPVSSDIEQLKQVLWDQNINKSNLSSGKSINNILSRHHNTDRADLIDKIILRTMSQARYDVFPKKHFGLGTDFYCHFTSPIRRYADLMVHRSIKSFIDSGKKITIKQEITDHLSLMERNSAKAERDVKKLIKLFFIYHQIGNLFTGTVSGLMNHGLFIYITEPFLEGFMPINTVLDDYYQIDQNRFIIQGRKTKKQFTFGQKVTVQLTHIDVKNFCPEFEWVSWSK